MKALTLHPEWAWAITALGKDVENRLKKPPKTLKEGDLLAIHSGVSFGGRQKYIKNEHIFEPVEEKARRTGWRIGHNPAENGLLVYNVNRPDTLRIGVHQIPKGSFVAVAEFYGFLNPLEVPCNSQENWPWWDSLYFGWQLRNVVTLEVPVPCRGQQGIWNVPEDSLSEITAQI